jgi:hypothetical protein
MQVMQPMQHADHGAYCMHMQRAVTMHHMQMPHLVRMRAYFMVATACPPLLSIDASSRECVSGSACES